MLLEAEMASVLLMFKWSQKGFVFICFSSVWLRVALETLDRLTESLDFTDYASRIIHPIVRTLDSTPELRSTSMDTLSSLVFQLGKKVFLAVLRAALRCNCDYWKTTSSFPTAGSSWTAIQQPSIPPVFITSCQTADVIDH